MKKNPFLSVVASLVLGTGVAPHVSAANPKPADLVTVTFEDPDHFTDVQDRYSNLASQADLDELRDCVQQTAANSIPAGTKLTVTFLDVDLAGLIRPDKDNIRVMTGTTFPRAHLKFQLVDNSGKVMKEGERKLSDMIYQQSMQIVGRNEALFYDKQLLKEWVRKEFKKNS